MQSNQYWILTNEINKMENAYSIKAFRDLRETVKFANDQFISFIWAIYWQIKSSDRQIIAEGLNDSHIETALKTALKDYK